MSPDQGELETLADEKERFTTRLAETFDEREIVRMMLEMGLRHTDLALALGVHPRTVRAWIDEPDRDLSRQRDGILALKALVLFLLRRGILTPLKYPCGWWNPSNRWAFAGRWPCSRRDV